MKDYTWNTFPTLGYLQCKFTDEELLPITTEIQKIKNNFSESKEVNNVLAGNIRKEYELQDSHSYLEGLMLPLVTSYDKHFDYTNTTNVVHGVSQIILHHTWVNFQQKGEFNPTHNHGGFLSFVIWTKIPYVYEQEYLASPGIHSNAPSPGSFDFVYSDCIGGLKTHKINVDKTMENTMLLFPSKLLHHVYPFFTSDEYRISVSGNFKFKSDFEWK